MGVRAHESDEDRDEGAVAYIGEAPEDADSV